MMTMKKGVSFNLDLAAESNREIGKTIKQLDVDIYKDIPEYRR